MHFSDDSGEDFFLPKLHDYPQADLNLGLQILGNLIGEHPRNRNRQNNISEIISAAWVKKILIRKETLHELIQIGKLSQSICDSGDRSSACPIKADIN